MSLKIRINKNSIPPLCIATCYAIQVLNGGVQPLFQNFRGAWLIARLGAYLALIVMFLILTCAFRNKKAFVISELVVGILVIVGISMSNLDNLRWIKEYGRIAAVNLSLATAAYDVADRKKLLNYLHTVSLIAAPVLIFTAICSYGTWDSSYNMPLGYSMVFTALVLLANFSIYHKIMDFILSILMCAFILFVGSRGPFICIFAFIALEFFLSKQLNLKKKAIFLAILAILTMVFIRNIDNILLITDQVSQDLGFDSRSLQLLMQGTAASHDSGRIAIWRYYANLINERPILGYGVMGEWSGVNGYPHNIILEFLLSYGYPIGIILLFAVFVILLKGMRSKDKYSSVIAILFVSYCTHLFVSNSYLRVWQFFVCIALCLPKTYRLKTRGPENSVENSHVGDLQDTRKRRVKLSF